MIYIAVILLTIVPIIITFAFLVTILKAQIKPQEGSIISILKVLKILEFSVHIETKRTIPNKKKKKSK